MTMEMAWINDDKITLFLLFEAHLAREEFTLKNCMETEHSRQLSLILIIGCYEVDTSNYSVKNSFKLSQL